MHFSMSLMDSSPSYDCLCFSQLKYLTWSSSNFGSPSFGFAVPEIFVTVTGNFPLIVVIFSPASVLRILMSRLSSISPYFHSSSCDFSSVLNSISALARATTFTSLFHFKKFPYSVYISFINSSNSVLCVSCSKFICDCVTGILSVRISATCSFNSSTNLVVTFLFSFFCFYCLTHSFDGAVQSSCVFSILIHFDFQ